MAKAFHCDREGCDTWERTPVRAGWYIVTGNTDEWHVCSLDCLMFWSARSQPLETYP